MGVMGKLKPGIRQFLARTIAFIAVFILISILIGPLIVNTELLYGFSFFIYGGFGKILLFAIVAFVLLSREKLFKLKKYKSKYWLAIFSLIMIGVFIWLGRFIHSNYPVSPHWLYLIIGHIIFLSIFVFLIKAIYGCDFIKDFIKNFRKEILIVGIFSFVLYFLMFLVWRAWTYLAWIVSKIVYFLLSLTFPDAVLIGTRTLGLGTFIATVDQACSGIYSMFLFVSLMLIILFFDWNRIDKGRFGLLFVLAIIGVFFINILRIYLLLIVGSFISISLAMGLFHSYAGMLLFIIYFIVVWYFAESWVTKK